MVDAEYYRNRRKARRQKFIDLLGGECVKCGSKKDLHFDHKNSNKKEFYISQNMNLADDKIVPEIKKCQLLCSECHKKKTKEKGDFAYPKSNHGTIWHYKQYKCRCGKCVKAMSEYYYNKCKQEMK